MKNIKFFFSFSTEISFTGLTLGEGMKLFLGQWDCMRIIAVYNPAMCTAATGSMQQI